MNPKQKKEKTHEVNYHFEGNGTVKILAKSKKEAEELFRSGEFDTGREEEWGENYIVDRVEEIED